MISRAEIDAQFRQARALHVQGAVAQAAQIYQRILTSDPNHVEALHLLGVAALQGGQYQRGVDLIGRALAIKPDHPEAWGNRGNGLRALGQLEDAIVHYDRALALKPALVEPLLNRGLALLALSRPADALKSLDAAVAAMPGLAPAHAARGKALSALGHPARALEGYDRALALNGGVAETHHDRAIALTLLGRVNEALQSVERALTLTPDAAHVRAWRGFLLFDAGRLAEALTDFEQVLAAGASVDFVAGYALQAKMLLCDWRGFDDAVKDIAARIEAGERASHPFPLLLMSDAPDVHRRGAELFSPPAQIAPPFRSKAAGERIKIGFFSTDFYDHPVAHLIIGPLEHIDRDAFEVSAFALGGKQDAWRARIEGAVNQFVDVSGREVGDIVALAREADLDIAVDVTGHTAGNRTGIFAARVAPVQMTYLGFLGTMGAAYIDYIIADDVIIPETLRANYAEKVISLPWFQCNDGAQTAPAELAKSRRDYGLPEDAFVFASFNNVFKLTPDVFAGWMRILRSAPNSVLWIFPGKDLAAAENLSRAAREHGIDPQRLICAQKVALSEHLARHRLADLFLDTFPYTAGATASNALRVGLPVLTRAGASFASRMGASLLSALRLPELIAPTAEAYEAKAIGFAVAPETLAPVKARLAAAGGGALFNSAAFTRHFEAACKIAAERARAGLAPDHITVAPL